MLGIDLPLKSATTVKRRLVAQLKDSRELLKQELNTTCTTISLSLDVWTSKNHLSILSVVGHWLTQEFKYKERILEFKELEGVCYRLSSDLAVSLRTARSLVGSLQVG